MVIRRLRLGILASQGVGDIAVIQGTIDENWHDEWTNFEVSAALADEDASLVVGRFHIPTTKFASHVPSQGLEEIVNSSLNGGLVARLVNWRLLS